MQKVLFHYIRSMRILRIIKAVVFIGLLVSITNKNSIAKVNNIDSLKIELLYKVAVDSAINQIFDNYKHDLLVSITDTTKIKILKDLFFHYRKTMPDTALRIGHLCLGLAEQLNENEFKLARCLKLWNTISSVYDYVGVTYYFKGDYSVAMKYYIKSAEIYGKTKNVGDLAQCYNRIGHIPQKQGRDTLALEYFFKALAIYDSLDSERGVSIMLNNIGEVYTSMGRYSQALDYHLRSLKHKKNIDYKRGIAMSYNNIGEIHFLKEEFQKALDYHLEALQIQEKINDKLGMTTSLISIGELYIKQNKGKVALEYLLKCTELATALKAKRELKDTYKSLAEAYAQTKNYQKAYKYHRLHTLTKDSVFNEESAKQITEMQTKYETEKKEKRFVVTKTLLETICVVLP